MGYLLSLKGLAMHGIMTDLTGGTAIRAPYKTVRNSSYLVGTPFLGLIRESANSALIGI